MNEKNNSTLDKFKIWWKKGKVYKFFRIAADVSWNLLLIFIILGIIGSFFVGGVGAGYFASLVKDEPIRDKETMRKSIYNYEETTEIYFDNNVYLGKLSADLHREEVDIDDVSQYVKDAIIATEDEYFNVHNGVVPKAIFRALFQEFTNAATKSGGSTLTQQLIKNQILTNEVSFERKAKEILIALRLEQFFEKEEILEAYLNVVPFGRDSSGRNIAGIQTAAQGVFGVDAKDLNLPQAAFLAGLPQSPSGYTPFKNGGELKSDEGIQPGLDRMKTVLERMLEAGKISESEYQSALNYDIKADFIKPKPSPIQAYPFLTVEIEKRAIDIMSVYLAEQDGYTKEDLENNEKLAEEYDILAERNIRQKGYRIHTTIDKQIYDEFQRITKQFDEFKPTHTIIKVDPETGEKIQVENPVQPGAILIENKTGKIIAFVAGRDFEISENNHATTTIRPNGSTMKPILDYAPAMELGVVQPVTPIPDVKNKDEDFWLPDNYTGGIHGIVDVRTALFKSYNIPAARTYKKILPTRPANYLKQMGFTSLNEFDMTNESMSIGSLEYGVSVEENTNAYVTFGNMGKFVDAYMIDKIVTKDGEVIFEHKSEMVDVFSPQTAYLTIDMMRDVLTRGTATYAKVALDPKYRNVDWAGKTGSTENIQDTWFVATNPNVTLGSWMGYDTYDADGDGDGFGDPHRDGPNDPDNKIHLNYNWNTNLGYSARNVKFWAQLVNVASELRPDLMIPSQGFQDPGGLVRRSVCTVSGLLPSEACQKAGLVKNEIFNVKFVPTEEDYSLLDGNYVTIGDKKYVALEGKTPEEFTEEGFILNPQFLKDMEWDKVTNLQDLIPSGEKWAKILVPETEELEDDGKAPSTPTNVKISGTKLTWSAPAEKDVIGYRIYMANADDETGEKIGIAKETEFDLTSKNQAFYVTAIDYFGAESEPSKVAIYGEIIEEPEADTITNLSGSATKDSVTLTWTNPSTDDFSHVKILKGSNAIENDIKGTSYTDNDVKPDTTYTYTVIAVDKEGNEGNGQTVTLKTSTKNDDQPVDKEPPALVDNIQASVANNQVTITFTPPSDQDFAGVNVYDKDSSIKIEPTKSTKHSITINDLIEGEYVLILKSIDTTGNESVNGKEVSFTIE